MDTREWREFRVGELFKVSGTKTTMLDDLNEFGNGKVHISQHKKKITGWLVCLIFQQKKEIV